MGFFKHFVKAGPPVCIIFLGTLWGALNFQTEATPIDIELIQKQNV